MTKMASNFYLNEETNAEVALKQIMGSVRHSEDTSRMVRKRM